MRRIGFVLASATVAALAAAVVGAFTVRAVFLLA